MFSLICSANLNNFKLSKIMLKMQMSCDETIYSFELAMLLQSWIKGDIHLLLLYYARHAINRLNLLLGRCPTFPAHGKVF